MLPKRLVARGHPGAGGLPVFYGHRHQSIQQGQAGIGPGPAQGRAQQRNVARARHPSQGAPHGGLPARAGEGAYQCRHSSCGGHRPGRLGQGARGGASHLGHGVTQRPHHPSGNVPEPDGRRQLQRSQPQVRIGVIQRRAKRVPCARVAQRQQTVHGRPPERKCARGAGSHHRGQGIVPAQRHQGVDCRNGRRPPHANQRQQRGAGGPQTQSTCQPRSQGRPRIFRSQGLLHPRPHQPWVPGERLFQLGVERAALQLGQQRALGLRSADLPQRADRLPALGVGGAPTGDRRQRRDRVAKSERGGGVHDLTA